MLASRLPDLTVLALFGISALLLSHRGTGDLFSSVFAAVVLAAACLSLGPAARALALLGVGLVGLLEMYLALHYGGVTKGALMAIIGIAFWMPQDGSAAGALAVVPAGFWLFAAAYAAVLVSCAWSLRRRPARYRRAVKLGIVLAVLAAFPAAFEIRYYGPHRFWVYARLSPSFFAYHYLERYRFVFGSLVAASLIAADEVVTSTRYAPIPHDRLPEGVHLAGGGARNVVVIMGESSNPAYYGLYGHATPTTPRMDRMAADGAVCVIDDVHANGSQTRTAVPLQLSFAEATDFERLFTHKNIFEMARDAGYRTHWLGASSGGGLWGKPYAYLSDYADIVLRPDRSNTPIRIGESDDDALIDVADRYFQEKAARNLYLIHIFGNHMDYRRNVDAIDEAALPGASDYELSIHHTDRFVDAIYRLAEKHLDDFAFLYVADHGEVVGVGHGYPSRSREMYMVPMILRQSAYCDAVETMRSPDGFYATTNNKYLLATMLGYEVDREVLARARIDSPLLLNESDRVLDFGELEP